MGLVSAVKSFDPTNCAIRLEVLSFDQLSSLVRYHDKSRPLRDQEPIVGLELGDQLIVIDGNTRVNKWLAADEHRSRTAIVITPFGSNQGA